MGNFFRTHKFKFYVFTLVLIFFEILAIQVLRENNRLNKARAFLKNDQDPEAQPRLTGTPYLNYICTPSYSTEEIEDGHNAAGYRGKLIPVTKTPREYRILFLGGSTTYSYFIKHADSTLPEQVKTIIGDSESWINMFSDSITTLNVINAGLPAGTSAELLTHYQFKYRYYEPDLVVIHTGGNDSYSYYLGSQYQPDYSHYRNSFPRVVEAPSYLNPLLLSRFLSLLVIHTFYDYLLTDELYEHNGDWPVANWFNPDDFMENEKHNAFYRNIETLVKTIQSDSADVILVPFIYNKEWPDLAEVYMKGINHNIELLKTLSESLNVPYCDLSPEMIPKEKGWVDDCHLTATGINVKAKAISEEIENLILHH